MLAAASRSSAQEPERRPGQILTGNRRPVVLEKPQVNDGVKSGRQRFESWTQGLKDVGPSCVAACCPAECHGLPVAILRAAMVGCSVPAAVGARCSRSLGRMPV
jgi:hypothetical protein